MKTLILDIFSKACFPVVLRLASVGGLEQDYVLLLSQLLGGGAGLLIQQLLKAFGDVLVLMICHLQLLENSLKFSMIQPSVER